MNPIDAKALAQAFKDKCSCGFERYIILKKGEAWRWCKRCDGGQIPEGGKK